MVCGVVGISGGAMVCGVVVDAVWVLFGIVLERDTNPWANTRAATTMTTKILKEQEKDLCWRVIALALAKESCSSSSNSSVSLLPCLMALGHCALTSASFSARVLREGEDFVE